MVSNLRYSKKDIFKIIYPLVLEQTFTMLVGMVDVMMVAAVGEVAVSGVSLVDAIGQLIIQMLMALGTGGAVVCSQYLGKKEEETARRAAGQLLLIALVFSVSIAIFFAFGNRNILTLLYGQAEAAVLDNGVRYFRIIALSFPFLSIYTSFAALYRSMNNTRLPMIVSIVMNLINIAGNAICIFGLHWGVEGVAVPTLISRIFACVVMVICIQNKKNVIRIDSITALKPIQKDIMAILSVGIPNGVESGLFNLGKIMLSSLVSSLGTASIAGFSVAGTLVNFLYLPGNAIGHGTITIVGQCIGAGEIDQAKMYTKWLVALNYAMLVVLCSVIGFGRWYLIGFFNLSADAAAYAAALTLSHCLAMIIWPLGFTIPYALRAGFDTTFTMLVSIGCMWVFRVGLAYFFVLVLHWDVLSVWYAMYVDWIVRAALMCIRFKNFEKRIRRI